MNLRENFSQSAKSVFLRAIRCYTFYTPISKGKYRAFLTALSVFKTLPDGLEVETTDARKLSVDLSTGLQSTVFFFGEYESAITHIAETIISRNQCKHFLDVGANFGWYTTLFYKHARLDGSVHSFEPVPSIFDNLLRNFDLMGRPANVKINRVALGDKEDNLKINLFRGLSTGHASLSDHGRNDAVEFDCQMISLDSYLEQNSVSRIDFVKVDIEGAELMFLKGAKQLFRQEIPPIILMEMALNQTKNFGYLPNDLIELICGHGDYEFYKIDESRIKLVMIDSFDPDDIGANVICIPTELAANSVAGLT